MIYGSDNIYLGIVGVSVNVQLADCFHQIKIHDISLQETINKY